MPDKYIIQRRTASGLETVAELPALENGKIDMSWLPVVGESGAAIIARGSNANGEWVRWEDGTQVCWGTTPELSLTFLVYNTVYQATYTQNFPAQFVNSEISCTASVVLGEAAPWAEVRTPSASSVTLRVFDVVDRTGASKVVFRWFAIGRWK